jgi:osmotically-inducible protein OsmY
VQNIRNEITVADQGEYQVFGYVPGQQSGRQQQSSRSDITTAHQIALQLQQQLSDQVIHVMDPHAIYVMVTEGTVMLHGAAQDNNQKQQVERIVQNIQGVQDVRNELQVQGQQQFGQQQQQMDQRQRQMGQQQMTASDRRLAQQIEQQIERQLPSANIMASVSQGTVTLQGSVQDQNQRQQAERVARSVQGVRNVRNNLSVGGQGAEYPPLGYVPGQDGQQQQGQMQQGQMQQDTGISGDTQCVQMLKQSLTDQNLQRMAEHVYVTCHQGTMALYGYVGSDEDKDRLEKLTESIPGINEVDSNLIVREEGAEQ